MARHPAPNVPLIQARLYGSSQVPTAIVIDLSDSTSAEGAALAIANYHHTSTQAAKSHHYIVDEGVVYRCVDARRAAYHCPHQALSVLLCAPYKDHVGMWDEHPTLIFKAADLVAQLCLHHRIRPRMLDSQGTDQWLRHRWRMRGGIIVRAPGAWPTETFMQILSTRIVARK